MGHVFDVRKEHTKNMGRGNVVEHDSARGMNFGASDPRGDGAAIPEMPCFYGRSLSPNEVRFFEFRLDRRQSGQNSKI
jgi:hypothetical protein